MGAKEKFLYLLACLRAFCWERFPLGAALGFSSRTSGLGWAWARVRSRSLISL